MATDFLSILRQYWGYDTFRGIQQEIIESIAAGHDTLGLMPTGGGKSVTFQVPALARKGICIVITPLIALMKDQVAHLKRKGIRAAAVYSGMSHEEILTTLDNCTYGGYKFLYVSPERLSSQLFQAKLAYMDVNFITVDEAHCISQWGYDFRPSYLEVANLRNLLPGKPVLALTATATPRVVRDIQEKLHFRRPNVKRMSFARPNLSYQIVRAEDKYRALLSALQRTEGSAIVYSRNRKKTKEIAEWLSENGIPAIHFHAGLDNTDKDVRQAMWQEGTARVMVATNAFGMGIDKSNVRTVAHVDAPDSIEAYFQEAGRAGRDGEPAQALLLYNGSDTLRLRQRIAEKFPEKDFIRKCYEDLCCFFQLPVGEGTGATFEFNEEDFCRHFHYFPLTLLSALQILERAGYLVYREEENSRSRLMLLLNKSELYKLHHLSPQSEQLLQALLRHYGGLFSDYVYIEEKLLAQAVGMDAHEVYETFKSLNHLRILHYVPRRNTPYITFTQRRVDTDEIALYPEVYENRKKEYKERVEAMIDYATSERVCRQRIMLHYFGEKEVHDCGLCDVCHSRLNRKEQSRHMEHAAAAIEKMLADGAEHSIQEIGALPFETGILQEAVEWLVNEEEIAVRDGMARLL